MRVFTQYFSFSVCWGPAPAGSRETQKRNGIGDWFREREGKNVVDKKTEERKRLIFLGLHRKPIKLRDKKFALFTEATGALPVSRGNEDTERLPVQVLETRADKWTQGASMLQGISLKKRGRGREREREKKKDRRKNMGWPSCFDERGPEDLFFKKYFYTLPYT